MTWVSQFLGDSHYVVDSSGGSIIGSLCCRNQDWAMVLTEALDKMMISSCIHAKIDEKRWFEIESEALCILLYSVVQKLPKALATCVGRVVNLFMAMKVICRSVCVKQSLCMANLQNIQELWSICKNLENAWAVAHAQNSSNMSPIHRTKAPFPGFACAICTSYRSPTPVNGLRRGN